MTDLTDSVQNCGLHCENCGETSYAISFTESKRAIEEVKLACIEAVGKCGVVDSFKNENHEDDVTIFFSHVIKAIRDVT